jgi:hypothetical protein
MSLLSVCGAALAGYQSWMPPHTHIETFLASNKVCCWVVLCYWTRVEPALCIVLPK